MFNYKVFINGANVSNLLSNKADEVTLKKYIVSSLLSKKIPIEKIIINKDYHTGTVYCMTIKQGKMYVTIDLQNKW